MAQAVKNLPAKQKTRARSLGLEDPLKGENNPLQYSCVENSMNRGEDWDFNTFMRDTVQPNAWVMSQSFN